ncbi:hypothetical protein [Phenylobacterium sp.]|uniref:hypothetical protein n=1 Tax=Phenylobacterium sp. TaxID=1871053 RepID=UPI002E2F3855|nr:hypothetical protein [Phenylobacterium sp.]HEX3366631.1 hypothetical protein [Phenylobacterium sp.]
MNVADTGKGVAPEVIERARRLCPDRPIVFASGYADTDQAEAALGREATILRKPFTMDELARTIAALMREP